MNDNICNLKNLYRIITDNDYPVYSAGVIGRNFKKGLTLQKYWLELLLPDFTKQGKYGTQIFRSDGTRNRYFSQFCNRDGSISFYEAHGVELDELLSEEIVGNQAEVFLSFFKKRECNERELLKKLEAANISFYKEDDSYPDELKRFMDELFAGKAVYAKKGREALLNHVAYIYTFFVFTALYGTAIKEGNRVARLSYIAKDYATETGELLNDQDSYAEIVSNKRSILWCTPLNRNRFFGREKELYDLIEYVKENGHCLVSGIGGIGKTELLRQLLHAVKNENIVDEIITVQWENSIQESFAKALPSTPGESHSEKFKNLVARIRESSSKKRLILIDNVESEIIKDENLDILGSMSNAVILSSRMTKVRGFETYVIDQLSPESCTLVFRSAYEKKISKEETQLLDSLLENRFLRHTLTIGMVGRYMRRHDISIKELGELENRLKTRSLYGIYKRMYTMTDISESESDIMIFLSKMPNVKYDMEFFLGVYPNNYDGKKVVADIERLCNFGWLIYDGTSVSVHPFIAECVLSMNKESDVVKRFLEKACKLLSGTKDIQKDFFEISIRVQRSVAEDELFICQMVMSCLEKETRPVSADEFALYALAMDCVNTQTGSGTWNVIAEKICSLEARAEKYGPAVRASFLCTSNRLKDPDNLKSEIEKIRYDITTEQLCSCYLYMQCRYIEYGRYDDSMECGRFILDHTKDNDITANAYTLMIMTAISMGKLANALEFCEKAENTPCNLRQKCDIALSKGDLLRSFGKLEEAEEVFERIREIVNGAGYDLKLKWISSYAIVKRDMGKLEEAEQMLGTALKNMKYMVGDDAIVYVSGALEYCRILTLLKRFDEAERGYLDTIEVIKKNSRENEYYLIACNNLAVLYLDMGKPKAALSCLNQVMDKARKTGYLSYAEVLNNHARALDGTGNSQQALEETMEALPVLEERYGSEHPKILSAKERIARLSAVEQKQKNCE